ncbi:MAG: serine hydrolase, partial [Planctomycetota bacterium]|nr:serine hydrolase [Planctomycetota bacterium]
KLDWKQWSYVGYKGGSEPGVYAFAYLLQRKDGRWFSLAFTLNNSKAKISKQIANNLVRRTINALGRQKSK